MASSSGNDDTLTLWNDYLIALREEIDLVVEEVLDMCRRMRPCAALTQLWHEAEDLYYNAHFVHPMVQLSDDDDDDVYPLYQESIDVTSDGGAQADE